MRLTRVELENIAIIASLSVPFEAGFTVVTGETGAGKSLLGDAMSLAFGERVSPGDILRHGQTRGWVRLTFSFADDPPDVRAHVQERLRAAGVELFDDEHEIGIVREFSPTGSRIRLNGVPIARDTALALRPALLDVHGQHDLTSLFDPNAQRQALDALGDEAFGVLRQTLADAVERWRACQTLLETRAQQQADALARREAITEDFALLEAAQLETSDEDTRLRQAIQRLGQGEKRMQCCARALAALRHDDDRTPDALSQLETAARHLGAAAALDADLQPIYETLLSHLESLKDMACDVARYVETLELSPEALHAHVERLDALEKIKRRFGPTLADAIATRSRLGETLASLNDTGEDLQRLARQAEAAHQEAQTLAQAVSCQRHLLAAYMREALAHEMAALALQGACFEVGFTPTPLTAEGTETVTFLFSANPGEPPRPLAKVASGGELSRFLLALKAISATSRGAYALVFDEIDAGVSGRTARAVAERLQTLAARMQVIAITHQPLVASCGQQHLHVEKSLITDPDTGTMRADVCVEDVSADPERRRRALAQLASGLDPHTDDPEGVVGRYVDRLMTTMASPNIQKTEDLPV